ncbi:MAG: GYD domain-containing protein [Candidatus Omnitrophica bacterium]|nr:GYD domain-containing protein [Candidatus Omnitrophota bacterium]
MAIYFMFGKYSREAIQGISANRTKEATGVIEKLGGKLKSTYALLGEHDLVLIVDFPGLQDAMKASLALTRLTNVAFSTSPAITVEDFDKMIAQA